MYIEQDEIRAIVKDQKLLDEAERLFSENAVESMRIECPDDDTYVVNAILYDRKRKIKCNFTLDHDHRLTQYDCDCILPKECKHIGCVLKLIQRLAPFVFPFDYQKDETVNFLQESLVRKTTQKPIDVNEEMKRKAKEREKMTKFQLSHHILQQFRFNYRQSSQSDILDKVQLHIQVEENQLYQKSKLVISLKIGAKKMYPVKDIKQLLNDIYREEVATYQNKFTFKHSIEKFDDFSKDIIFFLREAVLGEYNYLFERRQLEIDDHMLDRFYNLLENIPDKYYNVKLKDKYQKLEIRMQKKDEYELVNFRNLSLFKNAYMGKKHMYYLQEQTLYRQTLDEEGRCLNLIRKLPANELLVPLEDLSDFYKYVLSDMLEYITLYGIRNKPYMKEIIEMKLYCDTDDEGKVYVQLEVLFDDDMRQGFNREDEDTFIPLHQEIVEQFVLQFAKSVDYDRHTVYITDEEEQLLDFLRNGLTYLSKYCVVYASTTIRNMNRERTLSVNARLRISNGLLEVDFKDMDIDGDELKDILQAYRRKRKFYKLKNGTMITLEDKGLKEVNAMMKDLYLDEEDFSNGVLQLPTYRSFMFNEIADYNGAVHMDREGSFHELIERFKNIKKEDHKIPEHYETVLRDYQKEGFQWLKVMNQYGFGGILADDMGLGKTLQVIAFLESEIHEGRTSIVVAPSSVLLNWQDEVKKFSSKLKAVCINGNQYQREMLISKCMDYDLIITTYDYLRRDIDFYENYKFYYKILDEAQYIKNRRTKNAYCTKHLKSQHSLALTGTPIENTLAELWSLFDFLMPGYLFNYRNFYKNYEIPIVKDKDEEQKAKLKKLVQPFILRRNKKDVLKELPDKTEITLPISFSEEEEKLYLANLATVNKQLSEYLKIENNNKVQVLSMLTRLRQICCDSRLIYEDITTPSSKLKACIELIISLTESDKSVLVFSNFTTMLDLLAEELTKLHLPFFLMTGSTSKENRREIIQKFQNKERRIFLISLRAGGTGINLTAAQAVIHFDPWWNVSAENQASDRTYRIGQTEAVSIYKLIIKNTIEEKIQGMQFLKKELADSFVEGNESSIMSMSTESIMELLKIE